MKYWDTKATLLSVYQQLSTDGTIGGTHAKLTAENIFVGKKEVNDENKTNSNLTVSTWQCEFFLLMYASVEHMQN